MTGLINDFVENIYGVNIHIKLTRHSHDKTATDLHAKLSSNSRSGMTCGHLLGEYSARSCAPLKHRSKWLFQAVSCLSPDG